MTLYVSDLDGTLLNSRAELSPMTRSGSVPFLSTFDGNEDCLYHPIPDNDGARWYVQDRMSRGDPRLRGLNNLAASLKEQVVCLTCIGNAVPDLKAKATSVIGGNDHDSVAKFIYEHRRRLAGVTV